MFNIFLGIGIGGVFMMVWKVNYKYYKYLDKEFMYGLYLVEVGGIFMIFVIMLFVILVGMLIVVLMNKWIFSWKIGWILIVVWILSIIVNVVVEVMGVWGDVVWWVWSWNLGLWYSIWIMLLEWFVYFFFGCGISDIVFLN